MCVQEQLFDEGYIYKGEYEGWYSVQDECFLANSEIADGAEPGSKVSLESGHTVEWCLEENYLFRLTAFREKLLEWINTEPYRKKCGHIDECASASKACTLVTYLQAREHGDFPLLSLDDPEAHI